MFYVYVLLGFKGHKFQFYIGRTNNLKRRYKEHRNGKVWTTKRMTNIKLVFYEAFVSEKDSIRRERYLKSSKGRSTLNLMLRETLKNARMAE